MSANSLTLGIELEWPCAPSASTRMTRKAESSGWLKNEMRGDPDPPIRPDSRITGDPTVGLELVSDPLDIDDAFGWYADEIEAIEGRYGAVHCPTGLMQGSTAGLHIHISSISRGKARTLHQWSGEPWLQNFVCTSVVESEAPNYRVFRSNFCDTDRFDNGRYAAVNERSRSRGHYEWRLPEPMVPGHFDRVVQFLKRFGRDTEEARQYAMSVIENEPDALTSVQRADAIGTELVDVPDVTVVRTPAPPTAEWFAKVKSDSSLPYVYRVILNGREYYTFRTSQSGDFEVNDVEFTGESVLRVENLSTVTEPEVVSEVRDAFHAHRNGQNGRKTEAGEFLKDILKKKD